MANSRNDRVLEVLKTLGISEMELSRRTGKQPSSIYRITRKENEPQASTLKEIANATGTNYLWLYTGEGEMMKSESTEKALIDIWQDETYKGLQDQITMLKDELKKAWAIASHFSGGKLSFNSALQETDSRKEADIIPLYQELAGLTA